MGAKVLSIVQVCWDIATNGTREREISGIVATAQAFGLSEGYLLNRDVAGKYRMWYRARTVISSLDELGHQGQVHPN
jgi:hypothetical protein